MAAKTKTESVEKSGRSLKHQPNRFLGLFLAPFAGLLTAWLIHVWTLGVNLHWGRLSWVVQASHAAPFVAVSVITAATVGLSVLSWKFAAHRDRTKQGSLAGSVGTLGILFAINVGTGPHYWWSGLFILAGWAVAVIWSLVRLDVARNDKSNGDDHEDGFLERAGLKGWKARKVRPVHDERGEQIATEVEFQHAEGDTVDQLQDAVPRFESASAAPAGMSRATETDRADRSRLTVLHVDPLADVIKLPDPTAPGGSVADPAGLRTGTYSNGHPVLSYIAGTRNVTPSSYLFMGMTRTGKTTTENALLVDVQTRRDAVILYLNKAKGLQDVRPIIAGVEACVLADEAEQAGLYKEAFRQVKAIMAYRQGMLARFGIDAWSAECFASPPWRTDENGRRVQMEPMPFLIVHVGEADAILDRSGAEAVFLASKGLSLGVCTGWSLQRADHLSMPTGLRYNLGTAWCFGVGDNDSAEFALTTHVLKAGAHPEKWRQSKPGYFYFQGLGVDEEMFPVHARSAGIGANGEKITAAILTRSLEWAPRMAKLDSGSVAATNGWWEKTVAETTLEEWNRIFGVNVTGTFLISKYALPLLLAAARTKGDASIVNIGSYDGYIADPGLAAYCATKGAVHALTRAMACDHGPEGVRANVICPGYIDTPMLRSFVEDDETDTRGRDVLKWQDAVRAIHPTRRYGAPSDIANLVTWLASDEARYASGQQWVLDGGLTSQVAQPRL